MITTNVFNRVFHVKYGDSTGTAFTVDVEGRQYLVSAKHVFPGVTGTFNIGIFYKSEWIALTVSLVGVASEDADVVVLAACQILSPPFEMPVGDLGMTLGQDVYFLGFPFGLSTDASTINSNLPLPLVKKACISGRVGTKENGIWLLDGFNNPGFSGGPVVARKPFGSIQDPLHVIGIISGYRFQVDPVYDGDQELPISARSNTGIIITYDSRIIIAIVARNPIGSIINEEAESDPLD